jgi:hypothetical protein
MTDSHDARRYAPSTQRNREPIANVLKKLLRPGACVLEVASGTGEHAAVLSETLQVDRWWPSDLEAHALTSINAWREHAAPNRVNPPLLLDVTREITEITHTLDAHGLSPGTVDAIVCINMIHISPWTACEGLLRCAEAVLAPDGMLYLYGPFKRDGDHTAPSNRDFDLQLRSRDARWGVRDLEAVSEQARLHGLQLTTVVAMPANNFSVVFTRSQTQQTVAGL